MGVAAAGAAVAIGGLIGGMAQAKSLAKAQKKIARWQIASQERIAEGGAMEREKYSQMSQGYQDMAAKNLLASEQAKVSLLGMMGMPGTYGGGPGGKITLGSLTSNGVKGMIGGAGSLLSSGRHNASGSVSREDIAKVAGTKQGQYKGELGWSISGIALDPNKMAEEAANTEGFRQVSAMVAEASQFQNRQGKLWNQLNQSIVGGIYEGSAAIHKQQMEQIAKSMAKGGSARRMGLQMAQAMQSQEGINRSRTTSLWAAKNGIEQFRMSYVKDINTYSQQWVNNQAGIRDHFTTALNDIQMHWARTMPPSLISASMSSQLSNMQGIQSAAQGMNAALKTKNDMIMASIEGVMGVAEMAVGSMEKKPPTTLASGGTTP